MSMRLLLVLLPKPDISILLTTWFQYIQLRIFKLQNVVYQTTKGFSQLQKQHFAILVRVELVVDIFALKNFFATL